MAPEYIYNGHAVAAAGNGFISKRGRNQFTTRAHVVLPRIGGVSRNRTGPFAVGGNEDVFYYTRANSLAEAEWNVDAKSFDTRVHTSISDVRLGGDVFHAERMQAVLKSSRPLGNNDEEVGINFYHEMDISIVGHPIRLIYDEELSKIDTGRQAAAIGARESRSGNPRVKQVPPIYHAYSPVKAIEWAEGKGPDNVKFDRNVIYIAGYGTIRLLEIVRADHRVRAALAIATIDHDLVHQAGFGKARPKHGGEHEPDPEVIICEVGSNGSEPPP